MIRKYNHNAELFHESVGFSEGEFDKSYDAMIGILRNNKGEKISKGMEEIERRVIDDNDIDLFRVILLIAFKMFSNADERV